MPDEIAMQIRCVHCLLEQYAPSVFAVSNGEEPCPWCGNTSMKMTPDEYRDALGHAVVDGCKAVREKWSNTPDGDDERFARKALVDAIVQAENAGILKGE